MNPTETENENTLRTEPVQLTNTGSTPIATIGVSQDTKKSQASSPSKSTLLHVSFWGYILSLAAYLSSVVFTFSDKGSALILGTLGMAGILFVGISSLFVLSMFIFGILYAAAKTNHLRANAQRSSVIIWISIFIGILALLYVIAFVTSNLSATILNAS